MTNHGTVTGIVLLSIGAMTLAGCTDEAEPDLKRCEELEQQQKYDDAIEACQLSVSRDPESTAGKRAQAKIPVLETARKKLADEKAAALNTKANQAKGDVENLKGQANDAADRQKKLEECLAAEKGTPKFDECKEWLKKDLEKQKGATGGGP
jgi:hypothetical protein